MPRLNRPNFKAKLHTPDANGEAAVYFLAKYGGQTYKLFPGEKVRAGKGHWQPDKRGTGNGRANDKLYPDLNDRLDNYEKRLNDTWSNNPGVTPDAFRLLVYDDRPPEDCMPVTTWMEQYTKDPRRAMLRLPEIGQLQKETLFEFLRKLTEAPEIRQAANGKEKPVLTFFQFIRQFTQENEYEANRTAEKHLQAFAELVGPFDFDEITWDWRDEFLEFLYSEQEFKMKHNGKQITYRKKPFEQNYAGKIMARVSVFLNAARRAGHTQNAIANERGFGVSQMAGNAAILNDADIYAIEAVNLTKRPDLDNVRNLVIRAYCTGLRFSDWHKISADRVQWVGNRGRVMNVRTQKTKTPVSIPVLPMLDRALQKKVEPIRYIDFRLLFRELCELAGLTRQIDWSSNKGGKRQDFQVRFCEVVSTHDLRRSGLTKLALEGVPDRVLRVISGHSTDTQLHKYLRLEGKLAVLAAVN